MVFAVVIQARDDRDVLVQAVALYEVESVGLQNAEKARRYARTSRAWSGYHRDTRIAVIECDTGTDADLISIMDRQSEHVKVERQRRLDAVGDILQKVKLLPVSSDDIFTAYYADLEDKNRSELLQHMTSAGLTIQDLRKLHHAYVGRRELLQARLEGADASCVSSHLYDDCYAT
jgi:hypothetical protein